MKTIIERNNDKPSINTQEYFGIIIAMDSFTVKIQGRQMTVEAETMLFTGPYKEILVSDYQDKEIFVIAFSAAFYEQSSIDSLLLNSTLFFNYDSDVFTAPLNTNKNIIRKFLVDRLSMFSKKGETLYISAAHHTVKAFILDAMLFANDHQKEITDNLEKPA